MLFVGHVRCIRSAMGLETFLVAIGHAEWGCGGDGDCVCTGCSEGGLLLGPNGWMERMFMGFPSSVSFVANARLGCFFFVASSSALPPSSSPIQYSG